MENEYYIPISQIIAAPIVAMIEGETIAARATKEFIETVGFKNPNKLSINDFGELSMVTFKYLKSNADFSQVEESISVPILSLFPIPLLQIKNAEIEFGLDLTVRNLKSSPENRSLLTSKPDSQYSKKIDVYGRLANRNDANSDAKVQMKVKINLGQSDLPLGISKLFQIMDNATTKEKKK